MPLWRFKAGDFSSPIEAVTGLRPKIVTGEGIVELPASHTSADKRRAQREVEAVRRAVEAANGIGVEWQDEGGVVYSSRTWDMEALLAHALWLERATYCSPRRKPWVSGSRPFSAP